MVTTETQATGVKGARILGRRSSTCSRFMAWTTTTALGDPRYQVNFDGQHSRQVAIYTH